MPTMTLRIDDETHRRLEELAKASDRSKAYLATLALKLYLEENEWQVSETRKALDAADHAPAAEFVDHERVTEWLRAWGSDESREPPR